MGKSPQRRSRKVPCLITKTSSTEQERGDPVGGSESTQSCVLMLTKIEERSNKNGETRKGGGARH